MTEYSFVQLFSWIHPSCSILKDTLSWRTLYMTHYMSHWPLTTCLKNWNHLDQCVKMSRCTWPHDKGFRQRWQLKAGYLWTWIHMAPLLSPWQELCLFRAASSGSAAKTGKDGRLRVVLDVEEEEESSPRSRGCHPASYAARSPAPRLNEHLELSPRASRLRTHSTLFIYSLSPMFL